MPSDPDPNDSVPVYLDYTQAELDAQYDQSTLVSDIDEYRYQWMEQSARVREMLNCRLSVSYGDGANEKLDIFPVASGGPAPIMMFIHGGAWKALSPDSFSFPAERFNSAEAIWVTAGFDLLPSVSLDEQVRQNRAALAWLWRNAASFGGDPNRLFVSGHSSGGHVGSCLIQGGWRAEEGLPEDIIKGAVLVSGMYDLEPVRLSARNDYVRLDRTAVRRLSFLHNIPDRLPPLSLFWGEGELQEFRRQSRHCAETLWSMDYEVEAVRVGGANHFDLAFGFADPDSPILRSCLGMMGLM